MLALIEAELDCDIDSDAEVLAEIDALTDALALAEDVSDTDSDSVCELAVAVAASAALLSSPKTVSPRVAKTSVVSMTFSRAWSSSAWTVVLVTRAPPRMAPVATMPLKKSRPLFLSVTGCSVTLSSIDERPPPFIDLKRPNCDVAARSQCLPDLISLKRVTRSTSWYLPF